MAKNKLPNSINLLEPVSAPGDFWAGAYDWIFNIGKYLLIGVQATVLLVFFSRFTFDKINNDLTESINDQVDTLEKPVFKQGELRFFNLQDLTHDVALLDESQTYYSADIGGVINSIPDEIRLKSFTYANDNISMSLESVNSDVIREYEKLLEDDPQYSDIKVSISKSGTDAQIQFNVIFKIVGEGDEVNG